jgi:hypothetical protein
VLISRHTPKAWYQQEEVVLAIELARGEYVAHTIVPVYLKAARRSDTPYGEGCRNSASCVVSARTANEDGG